MRGVVLAGGTGSRLDPITRVTNKHLLPVGREPMIWHALSRIRECEISDVLVVTGTDHAGDVFSLLGSGTDRGLRLTYRVQDEAGGIAHALRLARDFVGYEPFVVLLGDNIFGSRISPYAHRFVSWLSRSFGATSRIEPAGMVLLRPVPDPERFGVPKLAENGRIVEIVEKPADPPSRFAVTGCYFLVGEGIFDMIADLKPSARGELEISDLLTSIARRERLHHEIYDGQWTDAGTFESLDRANEMLRP